MDIHGDSVIEEGHDTKQEVPTEVNSTADEMQFFQYEEENFACFPRCEYRARFNGSSAFNMKMPDVWNTYFRSTPSLYNTDRVYSLIQNKYLVNGHLRDRFPEIKAGTFLSPFSNAAYKRMFPKKRHPKNRKSNEKQEIFNFYIYDELIQYKLSICDFVIGEYRDRVKNSKQHLKLYFENIYPCIQIQVLPIENAKLHSDEEYSSFYEIVFTYFTALTNSIAFKNGIPTEMVARASFSFCSPCVSKAIHSFRISVGIVSKVYAKKVLVESLVAFNELFPRFLRTKLGATPELVVINEKIRCYNERIEENARKIAKNHIKTTEMDRAPAKVEKWNEDDTVFSLLCKTGDSFGKTVLCRVTARRKFVELLGNYVHEELIEKIEKKRRPNLVAPLKRLLLQLEFKEQVIVNVQNENDYFAKKVSFTEADNDIRCDNDFWGIMTKISTIFEKSDIHFMSEVIKKRQMLGIYSLIERSNVEFIRNSSDRSVHDEYGSDSDCEFTADFDEIQQIVGYCKKITVATGMRAVSLAHFIAIYRAGVKGVNTEFMYYETEDSLQFINDIIPNLNLNHVGAYQETVRYIDLNYCNAAGKTQQLSLETELDEMLKNGENEVVVFDYTTTTTDQMNEAIRLFIPHVKCILLVNSGLKNEQLGADINTHGTIRIVTKDANELNRMYYGLKGVLSGNEELPKQVHDIRRAYKRVGAAVTNEAIFKKNGSQFKSNENQHCVNERCEFDETFSKVFYLFFTGQYENELCNLVKNYKNDAKVVFTWDFAKIKLLGSEEVRVLVDKGVNFEHILKCYEKDSHLTETICSCVDYNVGMFNHRRFIDVFNEYRKSDNTNATINRLDFRKVAISEDGYVRIKGVAIKITDSKNHEASTDNDSQHSDRKSS